jgi:hypothetical protein
MGMGIEWINIDKEGEPKEAIDCCLIMYGDDYEFGRLAS